MTLAHTFLSNSSTRPSCPRAWECRWTLGDPGTFQEAKHGNKQKKLCRPAGQASVHLLWPPSPDVSEGPPCCSSSLPSHRLRLEVLQNPCPAVQSSDPPRTRHPSPLLSLCWYLHCRACELQILKPVCVKPVLCNKRSHCNEKAVYRHKEQAPLPTTRESPHSALKTQLSQKKI